MEGSGFRCVLCEHRFATVQPYYCKRCSHTLSNGASELLSRRRERDALRADIEARLGALEPRQRAAAELGLLQWRNDALRAQVEQQRARNVTARQDVAAQRARVEQGREREAAQALLLRAELSGDVDEARRLCAQAEAALRARKLELVAQLMSLLPVVPSVEGRMRIVNWDVPAGEQYWLVAPDQAAAMVEHLAKVVALLSRYLESPLPNIVERREGHRWCIRARGTGQPPEPPWMPLHPRAAGVEGFRAGLVLLGQNVIRLCFDHGILIRRGHEHELARNIHRLTTYDAPETRCGIGFKGPFEAFVTLPDVVDDDDFVLVRSPSPRPQPPVAMPAALGDAQDNKNDVPL